MNTFDYNTNSFGKNPVRGADDTTAVWKNKGNGIAYYNISGLLKNQPCRYGILINRVIDNVVLQTFYSLHGRSEAWTRAGNAKGWYPGSVKWIPTVSIGKTNKSYPDYDDKWKWCKYSDGTFKAEYKITLMSQYLPVDNVVNGIKVTKFGIKLPTTVKEIDVPKWDLITDADGLIWVTSTDANSEFIAAKISRAIVNNDKSKLTIGCTITGKWK